MQLIDAEIRASDLAHFSGLDEIVQCTESILDRNGIIGRVELVKVDVVGPEPSQAVFARLLHVIGMRALPVFIHDHSKLRRNDYIVTAAADCAAEEFFALRLAIDVGGVEKGDAGFDGGVHYLCGRRLVETPPEVVAAESDHRYVETANSSSQHKERISMRDSCRAIAVSGICIALAACASASGSDHASKDAEPIAPGIAVATFDSLWSKVHNTYVDTAFVATKWMKVRESLRPRAESITERPELDRLLADALSNIPDSHFYIIPARVATTDEPGKTKSDGRGTTGLAIRVAEGNVVAWRVEQGSPAWNAGIRARTTGRESRSKDATVR